MLISQIYLEDSMIKQSFHIVQMIESEHTMLKKQEIEYNVFCTYSQSDVLGFEVQDQYLYLVQPSKISVYEYHGKDKPLLVQEMIYNKLIKNYSINQHYICIHSQSLIEVRDRCYWVNLIYSHQFQYQEGTNIFLQDHDLYISNTENQQLVLKRLNLQVKNSLETIDLGKINCTKDQFVPFNKRPIFVKQLGAIQDFYIWGKDNKTLQLGMLYLDSADHKKRYQINQIYLKDHHVFQVYHHTVRCQKYPRQSAQYAVLVAQNKSKKQLVLCFVQILPKNRQQQSSPQTHQSCFQDLINQFSYLGKINDKKVGNSLIKQVLTDALTQIYSKKSQNEGFFEVSLPGMRHYQQSFFKEGRIWVISQETVCEIQLKSEDTIQNLMKISEKQQEKVIKDIQYLTKNCDKKGIGVYKNNLLFSEQTLSLLIKVNNQYSDSIAEEILQSPQFQENLNPPLPKQNEDIQKLCKDIIQYALQQSDINLNRKDFSSYHNSDDLKIKKIMDLQSNVFSERHIHRKMNTRDFQTQTQPFVHKSAEFQEIELLVAKYSSAFNASCVKIKQNHFQKQKFQKQMMAIVDNMAKSIIHPFLQQKFVTMFQNKVKEISLSITSIFYNQLQNLNETMRKIEIKEGNLRGNRIYQYSRQVQNIRGSVGQVVQALKQKQVNKYAFNQLLLAQAEAFKDKVKDIQRQVMQIATKNEVAEAEINVQIGQITQLVNKLCSKDESSDSSDGESEMDQSDNECSQEDDREKQSEEKNSQDEQEFQEGQNQDLSYHYYHPQIYSHSIQSRMSKGTKMNNKNDSKGYPIPGYPSQFLPPHHYPLPYFYPYGPQTVTPPPFQPYFHPQMPMPISNIPSKPLVLKSKTQKSKKRP